MMLSKVIDTTVRGVVYEAAGTIAPEAFATGIAELRRMGGRTRSRSRSSTPTRPIARPGQRLPAMRSMG